MAHNSLTYAPHGLEQSIFYAAWVIHIDGGDASSLFEAIPASKQKMWVTKTIGDDPQPQSLDCVFVDKHVASIASVVPHPAVVELNKKTAIVPIDKTNQEIPKQWFNIDLDQLYKRINNDAHLTNVFGCLTAMQPTEDVTVKNSRIANKRNLNLQNIMGETVRITLWGEAATSFEDSGMQSLLPPIFIALTSLKVKQYQGNPVLGSMGSTVCVFNPDIPQLSQYKQKFEHLRSPVRILPISAEMYADHTVDPNYESKTIDELLLLDPVLHKDQLPSNPSIASIDPQMPAAIVGKAIMSEATPVLLTPSQRLDQQPQSVTPAKTSKRVLFLNESAKSDRCLACRASQLGTPGIPAAYCFDDKGNYTTGSTYQTNLDSLLSTLFDASNGHGFYNSSLGENKDRVYAIALCRGDITKEACGTCLSDAANGLTIKCTNQKEAIGWLPNCMLRYSNRSIDHMKEIYPTYYAINTGKVSTGLDAFNQEVSRLFNGLGGKAATGGDLRKFASGNANIPSSNITIYGLAQCTPDLSNQSCIDCLEYASGGLGSCCNGSIGVRIVTPSCSLRYEPIPFVGDTNETPPPSPPLATPPANTAIPGGKKSNTSRTVIITVVTVVSVVLIVSICVYLRVKKIKAKLGDEILNTEALQFDLASIRTATNNFSEANKLGRGGFGTVYRGRILNQEDIAVKRLSRDSAQGDIEFKNEVMLVAKLQHRNLVRLLGFCLEGNERVLIYEFVPNASLDHFIFDPIKRKHLDWDSRYKIILGIGRGLLYLHEDSRLRIIHRDMKASNILLDAEMQPKIADFGMARLFDLDQTQGDTSRVVGTYGYMAPEYVMRGHFSVKSDVYSFGVLVLEIITGQKNSSFRHGGNVEDLLSYAWKSWKEDTASNLIDPLLKSGSIPEIMRCVHIGLLCVQQNIADRPTMAAVILMLTTNSVDLPVPSQPAFFMDGGIESSSDTPLGWKDNSGVTRLGLSKSSSVKYLLHG
ncbi:cysteine-rich receptor-like protein kinase 29 [Pyrus x bretschneideri]|uniref:cysteine-rich receptor-like protein kinase 29 n=1 Tax=Pyrus x bretschneideri TaxID=225117 RepID=UPI00202F574B|nr:cysteine-rich receptor-like protein kinase 29 [Pyrus x bretschneideri]